MHCQITHELHNYDRACEAALLVQKQQENDVEDAIANVVDGCVSAELIEDIEQELFGNNAEFCELITQFWLKAYRRNGKNLDLTEDENNTLGYAVEQAIERAIENQSRRG